MSIFDHVYPLAGTHLKLNRMGFGSMQLTGSMAWGQPRDRQEAIKVVREAIRIGINHLDTADFYGPQIANEIIREAIHPYPANLIIATKVGVKRGPDKSWNHALSAEELTSAVEDNLRRLGLETLEIVNLRVGEALSTHEDSIVEPLSTLVKLKERGLIKHIGLSNVSYRQFIEAQSITDIVSVQNHYNLAHRRDDAFIDTLHEQGIAFVPFFPLGGFKPLRSPILEEVAQSLGATTRQVALAWLLQRSPNILIIAGTSSVAHLHENFKAADLNLPPVMVKRLDSISSFSHSGGTDENGK